ELGRERHHPPPVLAQILAERERQLSREEALDPGPITAPLARARKVPNPPERNRLAALLRLAEVARPIAEPAHETRERDGRIRHERRQPNEPLVDGPVFVGEHLDQVEEKQTRADARFAPPQREYAEVEAAIAAPPDGEIG